MKRSLLILSALLALGSHAIADEVSIDVQIQQAEQAAQETLREAVRLSEQLDEMTVKQTVRMPVTAKEPSQREITIAHRRASARKNISILLSGCSAMTSEMNESQCFSTGIDKLLKSSNRSIEPVKAACLEANTYEDRNNCLKAGLAHFKEPVLARALKMCNKKELSEMSASACMVSAIDSAVAANVLPKIVVGYALGLQTLESACSEMNTYEDRITCLSKGLKELTARPNLFIMTASACSVSSEMNSSSCYGKATETLEKARPSTARALLGIRQACDESNTYEGRKSCYGTAYLDLVTSGARIYW